MKRLQRDIINGFPREDPGYQNHPFKEMISILTMRSKRISTYRWVRVVLRTIHRAEHWWVT